MKKYIFLLLSVIMFGFLVQAPAFARAKEIRFVQVTDTHYSPDNPYSEKVLKNTIDDINHLNNVSFVVFTGDNINKQNPEYLKRFMRIINKLKAPYYLTLGNHDVFRNNGLSKQQYMDIVKNYNLLYPTKKKLEKYHNKPVVILQHFPLVPPKDIKSYRTYQADVYLDLLKKHHNVIAVIAGHYHINGETMQDGIYHITTPTLLNNPHQYKIIDISTVKGFSSMIYTQLKDVEVDDSEL